MRAALNDVLVQKTLHPPRIPRKYSSAPVKAASSSVSSADRGGTSSVVPQLQKPTQMASSSSTPQEGRKWKGLKGKAPFSHASQPFHWQASGCREAVLLTGSLVCYEWGAVCQRTRGTGRLLGQSPGCCPLQDGYRIPFVDSPPPLAHTPISFPTYRSGTPRSLVLCQEIKKMLVKDVLKIVLDPGPGIYNRLFLVEKATGLASRDRPLSPERVCPADSVKDGDLGLITALHPRRDFLVSIDLKNAHFQIPVHQSSRKLLRFLLRGWGGGGGGGREVYQFKALCFGLLTTPQVFTRVFAVV